MNHSFRKSVARFALFLLSVCVYLSPAFAQQTLGSINGTVLDASGGAVPGATIKVTDAEINVTQVTTTQKNGFFSDLQPADWRHKVLVTHDGFPERSGKNPEFST